jgi:pimeloyl-ACP methyl ester carboxylesterase
VDHYIQLMAAGDQVFRKWDFGSAKENQAHYGKDTPTEYTYEGYSVPTLIISGDSDNITTPHNTDHLIAEVRKAYSNGRRSPKSLQCYQLADAGH